MTVRNDSNLSHIKAIMKSQYFDGLDQYSKSSILLDQVCLFVCLLIVFARRSVYIVSLLHMYCYINMCTIIVIKSIEYNNFGYLSLLRQYLDKNRIVIAKSLNEQNSHPLLELVNDKNDHINEDWFELYFGLCFDCKCSFTKEICHEAINLSKYSRLKKYQKLIEKNFQKMQQSDASTAHHT